MMSPGHDMASAQEQSRCSSQNARRDHELRIIGDCWLLEDRTIFFLKVWSLIGCSCPAGWPHTHMHTASLIRLCGLYQKKREEYMPVIRECAEEPREGRRGELRISIRYTVSTNKIVTDK